MPANKADIIAQLQKNILSLQGLKPIKQRIKPELGLKPLNLSFPNQTFPLGAIHEFHCTIPEDAAATTGFIAGLLSGLMHNGSIVLWIHTSLIFPSALSSFGIQPDRIIFINPAKDKDVLYIMEQALKCSDLAAVVGEVRQLDFTASRRLQLAVEQSCVTGFIICRNAAKAGITASVARWRITSLPGIITDDSPGIGHPRWKAELLKIRNGKPGAWEIHWFNGRFCFSPQQVKAIPMQQPKKTG